MGRRIQSSWWLRTSVAHIYMLAKGIRDGTRVPAVTLKSIASIAESTRRKQADGALAPIEASPIWPVYAPFHPVRVRWAELQARGELTPELADELQVAIYEAAYALVGESRSHRPVSALVMYDGGRLRTARPQAVGMANFIIGQSTGRLDPSPPLGTTVVVSATEGDPASDLTL